MPAKHFISESRKNMFRNLTILLLLFLPSIGFPQQADQRHMILSFDVEWVSSAAVHPDQALLRNGSTGVNGLPEARLKLPWESDRIPDNVVISSISTEKVTHPEALDWYNHRNITPDLGMQLLRSRNEQYIEFSLFPYVLRDNVLERITQLNIELILIPDDIQLWKHMTGKETAGFATQSVLATGNWYKLSVASNGIYSLTYNDLLSLGMNPATINPKHIRIYGNGGGMLPEANASLRYDDLVENAIMVTGEDDGRFDAGDLVLFYAVGPHQWQYNTQSNTFEHVRHLYDDLNYYFLTADQGPGLRVTTLPEITAQPDYIVRTYQDYAIHEKEDHNLIKSGKQWFGERFDIIKRYDLPTVSFPDLDLTAEVKVRASVVGRSTSLSSFRIVVDGVQVMTPFVPPVPPGGYNNDYARQTVESGSLYPLSTNISTTVYYDPIVTGSIGWLDYIEYNVWRNMAFRGGQLRLRNASVIGPTTVSSFRLTNANAAVKVWDVTDPLQPFQVPVSLQQGELVWLSETPDVREFVAFDATAFLKPGLRGRISNQNLHALPAADMIIIVPPLLQSQAERLAAIHHEKENYSIILASPQEIYHEFSSGKQDISAIRDFLRMIYLRGDSITSLKYVLLFGDGSYDPKDREANNTNLIPAYQSWNSLQPTSSYVTDDFYGLMDENEGDGASGILDLGIGRFPVHTLEQARIIVDKIERYIDNGLNSPITPGPNEIPSLANWRNDLCFIADDQDGNLHLIQAEDLITYVQQNHPRYNIDKIYLDAYQQVSTPGGQRYPQVNVAINERVGKGALIVNYTGHGGETGLGHERIVEIADINSWSNRFNMPVFVTATCEFSRFDDPERTSAGELSLLNPIGGGVALFTTTRLSFSSSNFALNLNFYTRVFDKINGRYPKMGDVIRMAKNPSNPNIRNFVLLGDPALQLAYPEYDVQTSHINGQSVSGIPDTLKALEKVTISGFISDDMGNVVTDFNGYVVPTVFDKPAEVTTLGNDPDSSPRKFWLQRNIIYRGKASVVNGMFSFSFVVPKDIAYKIGKGRISYYATNEVTDAGGYYEGIVIGGSAAQPPVDLMGPEIRLFMNDTNFVMGGITDENPLMLAYVSDSSGINTVGNGIGHDIVAILDGNTDRPIVLNDYYESDLDSYQKGTVRYPFSRLSEGLHTLELKVWDVYNNSSTAYIEFVVARSGALTLSHLYNYPNPFSDQTWFVFEHNQPGRNLNIDIRIYSMDGRLVRQMEERVITSGFRTNPIPWRGDSDAGNPLAGGLYIYRVRVDGGEGFSNEMSGKLVLVR